MEYTSAATVGGRQGFATRLGVCAGAMLLLTLGVFGCAQTQQEQPNIIARAQGAHK